jgi:hypothetical protein
MFKAQRPWPANTLPLTDADVLRAIRTAGKRVRAPQLAASPPDLPRPPCTSFQHDLLRWQQQQQLLRGPFLVRRQRGWPARPRTGERPGHSGGDPPVPARRRRPTSVITAPCKSLLFPSTAKLLGGGNIMIKSGSFFQVCMAAGMGM